MELKVHIEHDPRFRGTAIYLYGSDKDGEFVIEPINLVVRHYQVGEALDSPTFIFSGHDGELFLQSLAEALVRIGFKPNELKALEGEKSAINYHLEDMRKIVFNKPNP